MGQGTDQHRKAQNTRRGHETKNHTPYDNRKYCPFRSAILWRALMSNKHTSKQPPSLPVNNMQTGKADTTADMPSKDPSPPKRSSGSSDNKAVTRQTGATAAPSSSATSRTSFRRVSYHQIILSVRTAHNARSSSPPSAYLNSNALRQWYQRQHRTRTTPGTQRMRLTRAISRNAN